MLSRKGVLSISGVVLLAACATAPRKPSQPAQPELVTVRWQLPVVALASQTRATQQRGGVTLSVAPVAYMRQRSNQVQDVPRRMFLGNECVSYFYRRQVPMGTVEPTRLQFTVMINNGLTNVFRGAGALVNLNVNGQPQALDQSGYAELLSAMVPPRGQAQVSVLGPSLTALPDSALIGLFMYDVVTSADAAGNPSRRENFEWYFDYRIRSESEQAPVTVEAIQRPTPGCVPTPPARRRG